MQSSGPTLGTLLRTLVEHLDGAVEAAYADAGIDWRPRYTPVMRALLRNGPASLRDIAAETGTSHSAVSQTVAQMRREGLLVARGGADKRERIVALSPRAEAMIPALQRQQSATNAAAAALDAELPMPLGEALAAAIAALARDPFADRIARESARLAPKS